MIQKETREDQYKGKEKKGNTREKELAGKFDKGKWEKERVGKHDKDVKGIMNRERKKENWIEIEKERDL